MKTIYMDVAHAWRIETLGAYEMHHYCDSVREYDSKKKKKPPTVDHRAVRKRGYQKSSRENATLSNFQRHMKSCRVEAETNAFKSAFGSSLLVPGDSRVRFDPPGGLDGEFDEASFLRP